MVETLGHIAMGLLWAVPAWFLWDGRISLAFIAFVVSTSMLPDLDLLLMQYVQGIQHHGVVHTILFVVVFAVIAGVLVTAVVDRVLKRWWVNTEHEWLSTMEVYVFVTGGLILGGLSHLFADMLSAPDGGGPIQPFWPFFAKPVSVDVIYYGDPTWNLGFFVVAVILHLVLAYGDAGPTWFGASR